MGAAQRGSLIVWNWHIPGIKNGPVGIKTPVELGGTKQAGNGGNKTQAVVLHLIKRLPEPPQGSGYHVFLDNLFCCYVKITCSGGAEKGTGRLIKVPSI